MQYLFVLGSTDNLLSIIIEHSNMIIAVVGALGALATLVKSYLIMRKWAHKKFVQPFSDRLAKIDAISSTLGPNGGKSLYDRIVKMDEKIASTDVRGRNVSSILDLYEWQFDEQGHCTYVNPAACRLLGRHEDEFIGNNWETVISEFDRDRFIEEWNSAIKSKRSLEIVCSMTKYSGETVKFKLAATPLFDSCKELKGWLTVARVV